MTFFPVTPFSRSLLLQVGVHINFQIYYTFFYSHLFVFLLLIGSLLELLVFVTHEAAMAQGMGRKPCVSPQAPQTRRRQCPGNVERAPRRPPTTRVVLIRGPDARRNACCSPPVPPRQWHRTPARVRYRHHVQRCSRRGGQRSWTAINPPPWHLQHHTSHRNTICISTVCMPTPHTSMKQFHPAVVRHRMQKLHACKLFRNRYTLTKHPTPSTPNIHHTTCPLSHCRRARDSFPGATVMDSDQRTPMASRASHVASKYDLHPHLYIYSSSSWIERARSSSSELELVYISIYIYIYSSSSSLEVARAGSSAPLFFARTHTHSLSPYPLLFRLSLSPSVIAPPSIWFSLARARTPSPSLCLSFSVSLLFSLSLCPSPSFSPPVYIRESFSPLPFPRPKIMHSHMSACACACASVHMCPCAHGCIDARVRTYMRLYMHECMRRSVNIVCKYMYMHAYRRVYVCA